MRKRVEGLRLEETGESWQKSRFKVTSPLSVYVCVCVCVGALVRMYWSCGCNYECVKSFLWSFLSLSHMWWHSLSAELPLIRLLHPDTLSEEHFLDFHGRARPFSPNQLVLAWGVCVIMTRTQLSEHRKRGFIIFRHAITRKLNPGGFGVESDDQPANIWTCLCFCVSAHSQVEASNLRILLRFKL